MSDYTPPAVVTPTPGGAAGDGSLNGALTAQANDAAAGTAATFVKEGKGGWSLLSQDAESTPRLIVGGPRFSGYQFGESSTGFVLRDYSTSGNPVIYAMGGIITASGSFGVAPIVGLDNRTGLTAADSAALTLYTTTASGQLYRLSGRILATAGTTPSATYTLKWTEGGTAQTETLTLSALNSIEAVSVLIQPDSGTAITAQLTAISGTSTTVNVAAAVEEMA